MHARTVESRQSALTIPWRRRARPEPARFWQRLVAVLIQCWCCSRPASSGREISFSLLAERLSVLTEVFQCPVNQPADLLFQLLDVAPHLGEARPTALKGLADEKINFTLR